MNNLAIADLGESLNRLVKLDLDLGLAATIEEAYERFSRYQATLAIDASVAHSAHHQTCLLTLLTLAKKCFLGGVSVCGDLNVPLRTPLPFGSTLRDAIIELGGRIVSRIDADHPLVTLGDFPAGGLPARALRCTFEGWRGGIVPVASKQQLSEIDAIGPAITLSAALAVNEVFTLLRGDNAEAGYRPVGGSLWNIEDSSSWLHQSSDGPTLSLLPTGVWLAGLGHLGQAYAWNLMLLPYANPEDLSLVLQDFDTVTEATISTGMLAQPSAIGQCKTRMVGQLLERRGYKTQLVERRFDNSFTINEEEPRILIAGFDNALARQHLEAPGFALVVDVGLGHGSDDFQAIRLHRFPARRAASDVWTQSQITTQPKTDLPAYQNLGERGLDQCGITLLAERAVGAPFVGCTAAAIAISEILRVIHGEPSYSVIDLDLRAPCHWIGVPSDHGGITNPGITRKLIKR